MQMDCTGSGTFGSLSFIGVGGVSKAKGIQAERSLIAKALRQCYESFWMDKVFKFGPKVIQSIKLTRWRAKPDLVFSCGHF